MNEETIVYILLFSPFLMVKDENMEKRQKRWFRRCSKHPLPGRITQQEWLPNTIVSLTEFDFISYISVIFKAKKFLIHFSAWM